MDQNHIDDESPKEFRFPMSKHEKQNHKNLEHNINSIIDDDDDFEIKYKQVTSSPPIDVQPFSNDSGTTNSKVQEFNSKKTDPSSSGGSDKVSESASPTKPNAQGGNKKLSILSNNYKPQPKTFKKGKLKKPQSQKEPSIGQSKDLLGNFGRSSQFYRPNYENDSNNGGNHLTSIHDIENSSVYSMPENSTTSSTGESGNMYHNWDTYSAGPPQYIQPQFNMYPPNYYQPQPPPGFGNSQNMTNGGMYSHGYPQYMHNNTTTSPGQPLNMPLLDGHSHLHPHMMHHETHKSPDNRSAKSPSKGKKGFRKVKSTNDKVAPIDPIARSLIFNCDKCTSIAEKLELLKGNLDCIIYNQSGSRFLQKLLTKANKEVIDFFLSEIESSLNKLMMDKYGNYFCQELLLSCSGTQRLEILKKIEPNFAKICQDKKGTHTIQKMVELVNLPVEEEFFKGALTGHVDYLAIDQQGTHIIQKVICCISEPNRQFVFDEVKNSFLIISKASHGLCVIKKLVANTKNLENKQSLIDYVSENVIELAQDPYGNYAIQEVMDKWKEYDYNPLFAKIKTRIAQLSIQKFSSNVVEKCLQMSDEVERNDIIMHLAQVDKLANVMKNSFGNYVVQKALTFCTGEVKQALIDSIKLSIPDIQDKKIKTKWEQILGVHSMSNSPEHMIGLKMGLANISPLKDSWNTDMHGMLPHSNSGSPGLPTNQNYSQSPAIEMQPMEAPLYHTPQQFHNFDDGQYHQDHQNANGWGIHPFGNNE
jgi:hypothetical protein